MVPMPTSIPKPLIDGHQQAEADIGETCEFEAGEARRAPIYLTVPNMVQPRWLLTQAQFDDFHDWYEDDLLAGSLTFPLPIAEQGGAQGDIIETEAMFLSPPVERMIHGGFWEVYAPCVTGVNLGVQVEFDDGVCVNETFTTGLAAYSVLSGTIAPFNAVSSPYGGAIEITVADHSVSSIQRTFTARTVVSISFKFKLIAISIDDAGLLTVYSGGSVVFRFNPRRELSFSGGIGNAYADFGSGILTAVSAAALDVDVWYQFSASLDSSTDAVITRISDSALIATTNFGDLSAGLVGIDSLVFIMDAGGAPLSDCQYADIHFCAAG